MKRTIIVLMLLFALFNLKSQDTLKALKGNFSTELNVNLFQGELSFNNSINQIKLRYFNSDNKCFRFGFMFNTQTKEESSEYIYNTTPREYKDKSNTYEFAVSIGREKHFLGTKRLSPYIGFDIAFLDSWTKYINEDQNTKLTYKNVALKTEIVKTSQGHYSTTIVGDRAKYSFGFSFLTGFDFYISKNLYFGYEFSFGGRYIIYKKMELEREIKTSSDNTSYSSNLVPDENAASELKFGPSLINGIRLGYVF